MASQGLTINSVVITVIALAIGIVLIGSLLSPIATDVMAQMTDLGHSDWASLVGVVVVICTLGLVILAVNQYTKK